jgi:dolichol-phosphate mannosyltransferase
MMNLSGVSIVLPTLNEKSNLQILIPGIIDHLNKLNLTRYEIIIIDDNSSDGTEEFINNLRKKNDNLIFFNRDGTKSLPLSILKGIEMSKYEYVMWLDADGSMNPHSVGVLIERLNKSDNSVVIGSRFVEGGGYKGIEDVGNDSIFSAIKNVRSSKDSVAGMIFSKIFNSFLTKLNFGDIKDLTSGFVIGKKIYFSRKVFLNASYGEYFIYLCNDLLKNDVNVIEVGYICETRIHGISKTASNFLQLVKRGIPYIQAAYKSRKENT